MLITWGSVFVIAGLGLHSVKAFSVSHTALPVRRGAGGRAQEAGRDTARTADPS